MFYVISNAGIYTGSIRILARIPAEQSLTVVESERRFSGANEHRAPQRVVSCYS